MAKSAIEWTDETWNPLRGCRRISPGCENCYAEVQAARINRMMDNSPYRDLVQLGKQGPRWTGKARGPDGLREPTRWRKPRKVFVCSMSDLFYEGHPFGLIATVFGVMAATQRHTYQVLTKRPERMARWFEWVESKGREVAGPIDLCTILTRNLAEIDDAPGVPWPLPNVWIGVSVEDQRRAVARLPHLLRVPAAVRFVSYEPALGPVDFRPWLGAEETPCPVRPDGSHCRHWYDGDGPCCGCADDARGIDWLIAGSESGRGARPAQEDWYRQARDACVVAGVPFFYKQHIAGGKKISLPRLDGQKHVEFPGYVEFPG